LFETFVGNNCSNINGNGYELSSMAGFIITGVFQNIGGAAVDLKTNNSFAGIYVVQATNCGLNDVHGKPTNGGHNTVIDVHDAPANAAFVDYCNYKGPAINGLDYFVYDHVTSGYTSTGNTTNTLLPSFYGP
jgi:hypothetical protein